MQPNATKKNINICLALVVTFLPVPLYLDAFVDDRGSGIPGSTTLSTREHSLFSLLFKHCSKFKIPNTLSHPYPLPLVEPRSYDKFINSREMRKSLVFSASILGDMFCLPLSLSLHKNSVQTVLKSMMNNQNRNHIYTIMINLSFFPCKIFVIPLRRL